MFLWRNWNDLQSGSYDSLEKTHVQNWESVTLLKNLYQFLKIWPLRHYNDVVNSKPIFLNYCGEKSTNNANLAFL